MREPVVGLISAQQDSVLTRLSVLGWIDMKSALTALVRQFQNGGPRAGCHAKAELFQSVQQWFDLRNEPGFLSVEKQPERSPQRDVQRGCCSPCQAVVQITEDPGVSRTSMRTSASPAPSSWTRGKAERLCGGRTDTQESESSNGRLTAFWRPCSSSSTTAGGTTTASTRDGRMCRRSS